MTRGLAYVSLFALCLVAVRARAQDEAAPPSFEVFAPPAPPVQTEEPAPTPDVAPAPQHVPPAARALPDATTVPDAPKAVVPTPGAAPGSPPPSDELVRIEQRIRELERELRARPLGGYRVGAIVFGAAGGVLLTGSIITASEGVVSRDERRLVRLVAAGGLASLGIGATFFVLKTRRRNERKPYVTEWRALRTQRAELLRVTPALAPGHAGLDFRFAF